MARSHAAAKDYATWFKARGKTLIAALVGAAAATLRAFPIALNGVITMTLDASPMRVSA